MKCMDSTELYRIYKKLGINSVRGLIYCTNTYGLNLFPTFSTTKIECKVIILKLLDYNSRCKDYLVLVEFSNLYYVCLECEEELNDLIIDCTDFKYWSVKPGKKSYETIVTINGRKYKFLRYLNSYKQNI